jgi:uncharacterized protein involved in exopolysaccharide biosynthesis
MENNEKSTIVTDIFHATAKHKKFVLLTFVAVTLITTIVVLLLPRWYASTTTILPPRSSGMLGGFGETTSLLRQFSSLRGLAAGTGEADLYNYIAILKSRPALERIVRSFDLMKEYDISNGSMEDAAEALYGNLEFSVNEEGTLTIRVYDLDAQKAAAMADSFVIVLNELNIALNTRQATANRLFIERRIEQNRAELRASEDSLKAFQEKHGLVIVPEKTSSSIGGIAELYALKAMKELQLGIMERSLAQENVLLEAAKTELSEINRKLKDIPELGVAYFRLYRDLAVQQKIFEMLTPLYEQAKIEEQRNTPTLQVLESGNIPERPARPHRKVIVLVFAFLSLVIGISFATIRERLDQMCLRQPEEYQRLAGSWKSFTSAFKRRRE